MSESENDHTIHKVRTKLQEFHNAQQPVELEYGDDYACDGFVVTIGEDFAILSRLGQRAWHNGFRAIRFTAIQKVLPTEDAEFICRAMLALGQTTPPEIPFTPLTMAQFIATVCDHYPIVVLDDDLENENPSGVAGTIQNITDNVIQLRAISTDGYWLKQLHTIPVQHVDQVLFGSNYENTLQLIGELPDA